MQCCMCRTYQHMHVTQTHACHLRVSHTLCFSHFQGTRSALRCQASHNLEPTPPGAMELLPLLLQAGHHRLTPPIRCIKERLIFNTISISIRAYGFAAAATSLLLLSLPVA